MTDETQAPDHPLAIPGPSPLTEADAASIDILLKERLGKVMNTRPSEITDLELAAAVKYYVNKRLIFMSEENRKIAEGPKVKGAPKTKVPKTVAEAIAATAVDSDVF